MHKYTPVAGLKHKNITIDTYLTLLAGYTKKNLYDKLFSIPTTRSIHDYDPINHET